MQWARAGEKRKHQAVVTDARLQRAEKLSRQPSRTHVPVLSWAPPSVRPHTGVGMCMHGAAGRGGAYAPYIVSLSCREGGMDAMGAYMKPGCSADSAVDVVYDSERYDDV